RRSHNEEGCFSPAVGPNSIRSFGRTGSGLVGCCRVTCPTCHVYDKPLPILLLWHQGSRLSGCRLQAGNETGYTLSPQIDLSGRGRWGDGVQAGGRLSNDEVAGRSGPGSLGPCPCWAGRGRRKAGVGGGLVGASKSGPPPLVFLLNLANEDRACAS